LITSSANETIKRIRKLRDRKFREESSSAYVEGIRIVVEAVEKTVDIERIVVAESFATTQRHSEVLEQILKKNLEILNVSDEVFRSLSLKDRPQGISAVVKQHWTSIEEIDQRIKGLWVCLWEVADPGNLGTILRSATAFGVQAVVLIKGGVDPLSPKVMRAAMGAHFRLPIVEMSVAQLVHFCREQNTPALKILLAEMSSAIPCWEMDLRQPLAVVIGGEAEGASQPLVETADEKILIPMPGGSESLNAAVAASVLLYEVMRQRKA